jgi:hypothetical protein
LILRRDKIFRCFPQHLQANKGTLFQGRPYLHRSI